MHLDAHRRIRKVKFVPATVLISDNLHASFMFCCYHSIILRGLMSALVFVCNRSIEVAEVREAKKHEFGP